MPIAGELVGEGHFGEPGVATFERQQAHERADVHRLLDHRREQMRGGDRDVDTPHLGEHPLVVGVVHAGHDTWHAELLLGEQRDHEVVLVVAGDRGHDVGVTGTDRLERGQFTGIAEIPRHGSVGSEPIDDRRQSGR